MASIADLTSAAYRIRESAEGVVQRSTLSASNLSKHSRQLAAVTQGSKSGMEAVQQVNNAQHAINECVQRLRTLMRTCDSFIAEASK